MHNVQIKANCLIRVHQSESSVRFHIRSSRELGYDGRPECAYATYFCSTAHPPVTFSHMFKLVKCESLPLFNFIFYNNEKKKINK